MDTGLHSLVALARFHQLPAEPDQLAHQFGKPGELFADTEILQAAKALTLKAKKLTLNFQQLQQAPLPAIAKLNDGAYIILAKVAENESNEARKQPSSFMTFVKKHLRL